MDTTVETPAHRTTSPWKWILLALTALMVVMAVKIAGIFFLSREARALHLALNDTLAGQTSPDIRFSVGPGLLTIGRIATSFIDEIPDEVRPGLAALRHASVGIYHLEIAPTRENRWAMIEQADARMAHRGWERIIAVNESDNTVLIYFPQNWEDEGEIEVCLAVCDGSELVVVSAEARTKPLRKLVERHVKELPI